MSLIPVKTWSAQGICSSSFSIFDFVRYGPFQGPSVNSLIGVNPCRESSCRISVAIIRLQCVLSEKPSHCDPKCLCVKPSNWGVTIMSRPFDLSDWMRISIARFNSCGLRCLRTWSDTTALKVRVGSCSILLYKTEAGLRNCACERANVEVSNPSICPSGVSLEMSVPVPQPKSRMWLESRYFFARRLYQPSADSREGSFHQFLLDNWRMRNSWRVSNYPQNFWECFVGWTPLRNITIYYCFRVWCVCRSSLVFSKYWLRNPPWLTEFTQK